MAFIKSSKDGRPLYRVRWNYRLGGDGKQRYDERRFRSKKAAIDFNRQKTAGHTGETESITVAQLASLWLVEHVDVNLSQRTRKDYHCHYAKRISPHLGGRKVAKLTQREVGRVRDRLIAEGEGPRTVNKTLDTLKAMVRWGRSEGLCANTMIDHVSRVRAPRPKPANPHAPHVVEHIAASSEWIREATLIRVAAYSGLRWSELRALRWDDVDLERGIIEVVHALDLDKSDKEPKSGTARTVPVLEPGVEALRTWRKVVPTAKFVFPTTNDRPLGENNWYSQRLPKIREASGIHFDLHELRDTYASLLIQSGVEQAVLTLWLGHRRIQTTLDKYGRLFERFQTVQVDKVNAMLATLRPSTVTSVDATHDRKDA